MTRRRMSFYIPNTFPLPTTGRGPWLLQPGVTGRPSAAGGLSFYTPASTANPTGWRPWNSRLQGLGDDGDDGAGGSTQVLGVAIDPTMLALGLGALLLASYLFGGGRPKRKARRLRRRISRSQQQLKRLSA